MERRNIFCITALTLILFVLGSCGQDKKKSESQSRNLSPVNEKVQELDETPDEAMLVTLTGIEGDSLKVKTLAGTEEKTYSMSEASQTSQIKGNLNVGDTLSVFPENSTKNIKICINVSELSGRWFYDMAQHRGFSFETKGAMSSINADNVAFKEWKLLNGKLYLYFVDMQQAADDRHQYLVEEAEIQTLSKENLEFSFHGNSYSCKRLTQVLKFGQQ